MYKNDWMVALGGASVLVAFFFLGAILLDKEENQALDLCKEQYGQSTQVRKEYKGGYFCIADDGTVKYPR